MSKVIKDKLIKIFKYEIKYFLNISEMSFQKIISNELTLCKSRL